MPAILPSQFVPLVEPSANASMRQRSVEMGDGYNQRSTDGLNPYKDVWDLTFPVTSTVGSPKNLAVLEAFFVARAGIDAIQWAPPDSATANLYIAKSWGKQHLGGESWQISATFERVYL